MSCVSPDDSDQFAWCVAEHLISNVFFLHMRALNPSKHSFVLTITNHMSFKCFADYILDTQVDLHPYQLSLL